MELKEYFVSIGMNIPSHRFPEDWTNYITTDQDGTVVQHELEPITIETKFDDGWWYSEGNMERIFKFNPLNHIFDWKDSKRKVNG